MPGKRQHYVPRFLLRRFAIDPADKKSYLYRLEKSTGRPLRVNPVNEVVIGRYYRIVLDDGTVIDAADEALDRIEAMAADVVPKVADAGYVVSSEHVYILMLFIASLKNRTPQMRESLRETDEQAAELAMEQTLADRERYHERFGTERPVEEIEAERLKLLAELSEGRIGIESSPDREVALMFMALEEVTNTLYKDLSIRCIRAPTTSKAAFVLSDHPVAHYEPNPKTPESGAGFISSPNSQTWVPLDPQFGLLLSPQNPQTWSNEEATDAEVDELNLRTYAWARNAIYGPSQEAVTRVRRFAKNNRALLGEFQYRPPRLWLSRSSDEGGSGVHEFTRRAKGQAVKRKFYVAEGTDRAYR